jgi:hypothetical protein
MTIRWFGRMYTAPIYMDTPEAEVPVGAQCGHCEEKFEIEDDGFLSANGVPFHRAC